MKVTLAKESPGRVPADALAVALAAGEEPRGLVAELDEAVGGLISDAVDAREHRGRFGDVLILPTFGRITARRLLLYGLGDAADLDGQRLRFAHHDMARAARKYGYSRLAVLAAEPLRGEDVPAIVEGCVLGAWELRRRQTGDQPADIEELLLAGFGDGHEAVVEAALQLGEATNQVREWQNAPAQQLTPRRLAELAAETSARRGLELEVLGPEELAADGYNLIMGVAAGSEEPPRLIRLEYKGAQHSDLRLALLGKGITFDSGGLSIKTDKGMVTMRGDMAGAAAVLAAIDVIAARRPPINVMAVMAATENMISGSAQKPGDVVTSAAGKTVEVANTDAEGRLVLADAMTFALRRGATHLLDLATLTGAATIAIGHAASAALCSDEQLWALVGEAAQLAGERVWRLPIYPEYAGLLESRVADLRNSYYGEAGAIAGGMFIQQFTEGRPWAHLDIAASSWNTNGDLTTVPRGPLGTGARLCVHLAELMAREGR